MLIYGLYFLLMIWKSYAQLYPRMIPVAGLFRSNEEAELKKAFGEAIRFHNTHNASQLFSIEDTDRIKISEEFNAWEITRMLCDVAKKGYFYVMGSGDYATHDALSSLSAKLQMPFINWAIPPTEHMNEFEVSLKPPLLHVIADIMERKQWTNVSYICDGPQGLINLEQLSTYLTKNKRRPLFARVVQLPDTEDEQEMNEFFNNFHDTYHSRDHHVVMDVTTSRKLNFVLKSLKEVIIKTRNVHYLIASLDLTRNDIDEFRHGVVNITGIQLTAKEQSGQKLSLDASLAYDSINVAATSTKNLLDNKWGLFNNSFKSKEMLNFGHRGIYCNPSEDTSNPNRPFLPMENGDLLAKYLRNVVTDGLTGHIEFNENGFRKNFEVEILEILFYGDSVTHSVDSVIKTSDPNCFIMHQNSIFSNTVFFYSRATCI